MAESLSIAKTLNPSFANNLASVPAINVFPTPPFPDIAIFKAFSPTIVFYCNKIRLLN